MYVRSWFDSQKEATYDRPQISCLSHPRGGPWCCLHSLRASATRSAGRDRPVRLSCLSPLAPWAVMTVWCFWEFTFTGHGTPAPIDPPKQLVTTGVYRYVRNPIYVGVLSILS